ncbi:MAG TPA: acyl-CoA desaturase [Polyangiaceae bacterium]|nr:acyl-CoA desaturase [Polyangiaceae bacterium]
MADLDEAVSKAMAIAPPMPAIQVSGARLIARQWWGALATILLPTVFTAIAISLAMQRGVHRSAIVAWLIMHFATVLGITVGYHRLAAHRAFEAVRPVDAALLILGGLAAEGPVVHWVSNHRRHHQFSDEPLDVHSPHRFGSSWYQLARGFWHAHIGWMFQDSMTNSMRYSRDLLRDPRIMQINRLYLAWVALGFLIPAAVIGSVEQSWSGAVDGLLWGGFVRVFTVHHVTWAINSLTHLHGRRPYATGDHSANVAWLALPSAGESWHNCHHAFPGSARLGLEWWQFDLGYMVIWSLQKLRLVSNVNVPSASTIARARRNDPRPLA